MESELEKESWRRSNRLCNNVAQILIPKCAKADYENELQDWINQKWLLEYNQSEMGPPHGQIPLIAYSTK